MIFKNFTYFADDFDVVLSQVASLCDHDHKSDEKENENNNSNSNGTSTSNSNTNTNANSNCNGHSNSNNDNNKHNTFMTRFCNEDEARLHKSSWLCCLNVIYKPLLLKTHGIKITQFNYEFASIFGRSLTIHHGNVVFACKQDKLKFDKLKLTLCNKPLELQSASSSNSSRMVSFPPPRPETGNGAKLFRQQLEQQRKRMPHALVLSLLLNEPILV